MWYNIRVLLYLLSLYAIVVAFSLLSFTYFHLLACLITSGDAAAGHDLWDWVAGRSEDFRPRTASSERELLDCHQGWLALQVTPSLSLMQVSPDAPSRDVLPVSVDAPPPAVTVAVDSLARPGRGLLSVAAPLTGKFLFSFCTWDMGSALGLRYVLFQGL